MKTMGTTLLLLSGLVLIGNSADAALLSRMSGQAWYDTELDVTWVADADLAATNTFGLERDRKVKPDAGKVGSAGLMDWETARKWIAGMNDAAYLGKSDWRLPFNLDLGEVGCSDAVDSYVGGDCGWNVLTKVGPRVYSELAHLFYDSLQNKGSYTPAGAPEENCASVAPYCMSNDGPFENLDTLDKYWFGSDSVGVNQWVFYFGNGRQYLDRGTRDNHVLALRTGDIEAGAAVPLPGVAWLLGGVLALLGGGAWRRRAVSARH